MHRLLFNISRPLRRYTNMADDTYELIYWPTSPGRGEFIRLAFEESGTAYTDTAALISGADAAVIAQTANTNLGTATSPPPLAPPILRHVRSSTTGDTVVISQTANILQYLGSRLGLAPRPDVDDGVPAACVNGLVLTALDGLCNEAHDTHHPLGVNGYYEDQKPAALERAEEYRVSRLPKFLEYFDRVLRGDASGTGPWLYGGELTVADLVLFQVGGKRVYWSGLYVIC